MKKYLLILLVLVLVSYGYAASSTLTSFHGQSNPFNLTFTSISPQIVYLYAPSAYFAQNPLIAFTPYLSGDFADDFNRADQTLNQSNGWNCTSDTSIDTFNITDGRLWFFQDTTRKSACEHSITEVNTATKNVTLYSYIRNMTVGWNGFGLCPNMSQDDMRCGNETMRDGYLISYDSVNLQFLKFVSETSSLLKQCAISTPLGNIMLKVYNNGSSQNLDFYVNNTLVCWTNDTNWQNFKAVGLSSRGGITVYENFAVMENNNYNFMFNVTQNNINRTFLVNRTDFNYPSGYYLNFTDLNAMQSTGSTTIPIIIQPTFLGTLGINLSFGNYSFGVDNCSNSYLLSSNATTINYTIVDEIGGQRLDATITGTYNYTVDGVNYFTYTLDSFVSNNYTMCIYPNWASITSYTTLYASKDSYPQRRFYLSDTFTNLTQTKTLYLLNTSYGIYARFKVVDSYSNVLQGVNVKMYKSDDLFNIIEAEDTDGSGVATFWVNPDQDYYFTFTKAGYSAYSTTLRPTTSEIYTIFLGTTTTSTIPYSEGITYYFAPESTTLVKDETYYFTFNLTSAYWGITNCTFFIALDDDTILRESNISFSGTKCGINITYTAEGYDYYKSYAIVTYNSSFTVTYHPVYAGGNYTYSNYTIMTIFDDITNFNGAGFGWQSRMLLAFIIIVAILGITASKFVSPIASPETHLLMLVTLVWLFSLIGWLTVPNIFTMFTSSTYPEVMNHIRQYIIAIVTSLLGGSFIWSRYM